MGRDVLAEALLLLYAHHSTSFSTYIMGTTSTCDTDENEASLDPVLRELTDFIPSENIDWHLLCVKPVLDIAQEDDGRLLPSMGSLQSSWNRGMR